jgi:hypothetical protein
VVTGSRTKTKRWCARRAYPGMVTAVLAGLAHGAAPSTVARRVGVGYATVTRIAQNTQRR